MGVTVDFNTLSVTMNNRTRCDYCHPPNLKRLLHEKCLPHGLNGNFILLGPLFGETTFLLGLLVGHAKVDLLLLGRSGRRLIPSHLLEVENQLVELFQPNQDLFFSQRLSSIGLGVRDSSARALQYVGNGGGGGCLKVLGRRSYGEGWSRGCGRRPELVLTQGALQRGYRRILLPDQPLTVPRRVTTSNSPDGAAVALFCAFSTILFT